MLITNCIWSGNTQYMRFIYATNIREGITTNKFMIIFPLRRYIVSRIFEGKLLRRREYCLESVKNACCGCYLTVKVSAAELHGQRMQLIILKGVRPHVQVIFTKTKHNSLEPDVSCSAHKRPEMRNRVG